MSEEYGDIGPPNPELEEMLFHNEYINRVGIKFELYVFLPINLHGIPGI
jgi:ATP-dependent RNA helicase DDX3X